MWIKHTNVQRGEKRFTYLQLMKTVYENGRSRQVLVSNLGRADRVDEDLAQTLAETITDSSYLFLPDELLALLPMRLYGETFLLNKVFELTSLRRFLEDLAEFKGISSSSVDALLLLLSYYSFQCGEPSIRDFLHQYYIRSEDAITPDTLRAVFDLLDSTPLIHPGLVSSYQMLEDSRQRKCYYLFDVPADPTLSHDPIRLSLMTDEPGAPLFYRRLQPQDQDTFRSSRNALYLFDSFSPSLLSGEAATHPFIARITQQQLRRFLPGAPLRRLNELPCRRRWGDVAYDSLRLGEHRCIICRSGQFQDDASAAPEYLIDNLRCDEPSVLTWYSRIDEIRDRFYRLFLPKDLAYLYADVPSDSLIDTLLNLQFLRLFLDGQLSAKLEPINLTAADAYALFRGIRIAPLKYCGRRQLIHSLYDPMQTRVLEFLAFES